MRISSHLPEPNMRHESSRVSAGNGQRRSARIAAVAFGVGVLGSAIAGAAGAQSRGLAQELPTTASRYVAAWDTHDSSLLADYFTADADMIMGNSPMLDGRTAIDHWWRDYFAFQEPERKLTIEILSTRAIAADVALLDVRTTTGGRTAEGVGLLPRKARGTWVLVRRDGAWLIAAMRGMPTEEDRIIRSHEQPRR